MSHSQDELTATIFGAVQKLTQMKRAGILLNTVLAMIEDGLSREEVEKCVDVFLKTPGLPKENVAKALLARSEAQRLSARLPAEAQRDQRVVQATSRGCILDPPWRRVPPEIWERVAAHMHRYHLRAWLFVSHFHHRIASRHLFHTIDIYFSEHEWERIQALDIFDRVKNDADFASQVKSLRLHCTYMRDGLLVVMLHIFKLYLPAFKALQNFEWIGYPDIQVEMVQALLSTHKHLRGLGIIVENFPAMGVFAFDKLCKLTLKAWKSADMGEIRTVLDRNECTLKHLTLGGLRIEEKPLWDLAFESAAIDNLTQLHLIDTKVPHFVLSRIVSAHKLQSLTLPGSYVDLDAASRVFGSDRILDGSHTLLPHLKAFRFLFTHDQHTLHQPVADFLRKRNKLRRLDLGHCPWNIVQDILPDLTSLRALAVYIGLSSQGVVNSLVESIPSKMVALRVLAAVSGKPLDEYASYFSRFHILSFLHLQTEREEGLTRKFRGHTDEGFCSIAAAIPSLDFLVWDYIPYVVARPADAGVQLEDIPLMGSCCDYGGPLDFGSDDAAWLEQKDVPLQY